MPRDENNIDTDFPPQSVPTVQHGHDCPQERRIRDLERDVREHRGKLGEGSRVMDRLTMSVETLTKSVDLLNARVEAMAKPSPVWEQIRGAIISAVVPLAIVAVVWLVVQSGAVVVKAPTITVPSAQP
jgi:hypothetical protein